MSNDLPAAICLKSIRKEYVINNVSNTVLADINLTIHQGEMVAIVGPSGSGKSTLMNIIGCLDKPDAGRLTLFDRDTAEISHDRLAECRQKYIGFIFQRYQLLPWLSVIDNVMMPARYTTQTHQQALIRARMLMARLGMADKLSYLPNQLSGGQQQRTGIARALMNGAPIILADEPTGALDRQNGQEVMALLKELHREGHTIVVVTHDAEIAAQTQRQIHLEDGKIVCQHTTDMPDVSLPALLTQVQCARFRLRDAIFTAWLALMGHRVRAFLSMLGIIIGIMSVVNTVAIGEGARQKVLNDIARLGAHKIEIQPGVDTRGNPLYGILSADDLRYLKSLPFVTEVSAFVSQHMAVASLKKAGVMGVRGVGREWFALNNQHILSGNLFSLFEQSSAAQAVIIDEIARQKLFPDASGDVIGQLVNIGGSLWRVTGLVSNGLVTGEGQLYVPFTSFMERISPSATVSQIDVHVAENVDETDAARQIAVAMKARHGAGNIQVKTNQQVLKAVSNASQSLNLLITAIACISLFVGGIGVMNVMLVSVSERTREIGIRLAVGATRHDILRQFLTESVVICLLGGALGVLLSLLTSLAIGMFATTIVMKIGLLPVLGAFAISTLTGLVFGFFPARNAAKLNPVEAIARE
ncbi:ATP-binding cassette domain-containing protein [Salmonella enterica subsp. houtenae serovar 17:z29:-]|nr:ATP-binding cassette domain-containing protein [Salmonella enterica subsp. houtenae serovar 17:z29:-]